MRFNRTAQRAGKHMEARKELGRHLGRIKLRDGPYHFSDVRLHVVLADGDRTV